MMGYTFADQHPETWKLADKYIPGVWGSLREAWMKGFDGFKMKYVRTSAYGVYYRKGKEDFKKENRRKNVLELA